MKWVWAGIVAGLMAVAGGKAARGETVQGFITDVQHGMPVSGVSVSVPALGLFTRSDETGHFYLEKIPPGRYYILFRAIGYRTDSISFSVTGSQPVILLQIRLHPTPILLHTLTVSGSPDIQASPGNMLDGNAVPLKQVITRRSIEQSADITLADIAGRSAGVSLLGDKTATSVKAVIRGMDSRYSYISVNGMALPSPDDRSRYLSLDLFPSGIIDHLEIYKTLTPDMAGNAIGGIINIVTRPVPDSAQLAVNLATGYPQLFFQRRSLTFDDKVIRKRSPYEQYGPEHYATGADFTKDNLSFHAAHPAPDMQAGVSMADRFLHRKLGVLVAGSLQLFHYGSDGFLLLQNSEPQLKNVPGITDFISRQYDVASNHKSLYAALDYNINEQNCLYLHQLYISKDDRESRSSVDTSLSEGRSGPGTGRIALMQRSRLHRQSIEHLNLQGRHRLSQQLSLDWSGVYSEASGSYPDWAELSANTGRILGAGGIIRQTPELLAPLERTWLHNRETEADFYANMHYRPAFFKQKLELSAGTLLQRRHRDNFYNNYVFTPAITNGNGQPFQGIYAAVWLNNNGPQNPLGTVNTPGTYTAGEDISAYYIRAFLQAGNISVTAGVRKEGTVQTVRSAADAGPFDRDVDIRYRDWLPSLHLRYAVDKKQGLRLSYYRAISRPSLYSLTFFNMDYDDYNEAGNPFLKRSTADNFDLRYERSDPGLLDELQVTAFYKHIRDPFEKTLLNTGEILYPIPQNGQPYTPVSKLTEQLRNYGAAHNYGLEIALVKHWGGLEINANYTFTSSHIVQTKKYKQRSDPADPASDIITVTRQEERPLQGQSRHLAGLILAYHFRPYDFTVQLTGTYTGTRIAEISGWYGLDNWQKGYAMLDLSFEKNIGNRWRIFAKATNLLNSGDRTFMKGKMPDLPRQTGRGDILVSRSYNGSGYMLGVQYRLK
ncbi:TonB-dependent receptor domain-containing protein [Compostibacter hankyongensis]|uniref:TonB-dependent receptor n=1 Tax=Compostibacter hankyongensis TaxID=1007089 RepID=A0ABP8G7L8_9BACT